MSVAHGTREGVEGREGDRARCGSGELFADVANGHVAMLEEPFIIFLPELGRSSAP